jgi:lipopolysaccharide export LptBFGC system permease protein LptF
MLSPTLFWYIFKDLLKVFMLANGALAGILSFGGLLRPLTEQGLEAWQVGLLLSYFTPAMTAYSLPVAILFATSVVYGRLSADNEILACRAGGLSHLSLCLPAAVLGLVVSLASALLLMFVVPKYTLKIEKVVFANLAKIVANDIERKHQIRLPGMKLTVFARSAYLPQQQPTDNRDDAAIDQQVVLVNPTIVTFENPYAAEFEQLRNQLNSLGRPLTKDEEAALAAATNKSRIQVPKEFHTAGEATVHLSQASGEDKIQLTVVLTDGARFPRTLTRAQFGGVESAQAGPFEMPSAIQENTKFMDIRQLRKLYENRADSAKIKTLLAGFIKYEQQFAFLHNVRDDLNDADHTVSFDAFGGKESITIERIGDVPAIEKGGDVIVSSGGNPNDPNVPRHVRMTIKRKAQVPVIYEAREAVLQAQPLQQTQRVDVRLELRDVQIRNADDGSVSTRKAFSYPFNVPMSRSIQAIEDRSYTEYAKIDPNLPRAQLAKMNLTPEKKKLVRTLTELANDIVIESNSRLSFAISCLILTFVGCALGMMFRSGNFLNAFAISFIPAMIAITLIVAGQRVGGALPLAYPKADNPIQLGLILCWAGNAANAVLATVLWWRLQRQ